MLIDLNCPLCKGTGHIPRRKGKYSIKTRAKARKMYANGKTLRAIGERLGIKHPQSVKAMIMAKTI